MINWSQTCVVVTGGGGFLGQVVCQKLQARDCREIQVPRRAEYDLTSEADVARMYQRLNPDVVIHLAAEVGGIGANQAQPGRFFFANLAMGMHLIELGRRRGLKKLVQVGTVCSYPKHASVPFHEDNLWDGYPEETNAPYGVAKKALLVMLDGYHRQYGLACSAVVPVNLYGPGDNFDLETSHVIPALIRKCVAAKDRGLGSIICWGTGQVSREFLYVDDAAEGIILAAERVDHPVPINLGTGYEVLIRDLVRRIADLLGFDGDIVWDESKPDGQPRRCLDTSRAERLLGWRAETSLDDGLRRTIEWFRKQSHIREVRYTGERAL